MFALSYLDHALSTRDTRILWPISPEAVPVRGSVWAFFPDQISRGRCTRPDCTVGARHYRVFKGRLRLGCVGRLVPVHEHEAPHSAGGDVMEVEREGGLYSFSCPSPSEYGGRSTMTHTPKVAQKRRACVYCFTGLSH